MKLHFLFASLVLALPMTAAGAGPNQRDVLAAEQEWLAAYNRRDTETIQRIESDDFRIVFGDGRVQNKAEQLETLRKPLPLGTKFAIRSEGTEVRLYANVAILTGIVVESGSVPNDKGEMQPFELHSRYTDVWLLRKGKWQVVSSHQSDLKNSK